MHTILYKFANRVGCETLVQNPRLIHAFIKLNEQCNGRCPFCNDWKRKRDFNYQIDLKLLLDQLVMLNPFEINLHGGEVFLSEMFDSLLSLLNSRLDVSITTNGSFLKESVIDGLILNNVKKFYISVDHHDPKLNAASRGIPTLSHSLYHAIRYLKRNFPDITIIINHVVTNENVESLTEFIIKMKRLNVNAINLIPIKDTPKYYLSFDQIKYYYHVIEGLLASGVISPHFFLAGQYRIFGDFSAWNQATRGQYVMSDRKQCYLPYGVLFIECATGNVYPCDTTLYRENPTQYILGNLTTENIISIWNGERLRSFRQKMYPRITSTCVYGCDSANFIS